MMKKRRKIARKMLGNKMYFYIISEILKGSSEENYPASITRSIFKRKSNLELDEVGKSAEYRKVLRKMNELEKDNILMKIKPERGEFKTYYIVNQEELNLSFLEYLRLIQKVERDLVGIMRLMNNG